MSIKLKRHYPLLLALVGITVALVVLIPNTRITAYTVPGKQIELPIINHENDVDLFDDSIVHEIVVLISEETRERMLQTFQDSGEKEYFPADVIIDGEHINNVGIRLKGNASLFSVGGMGGMMRGMGGGMPDFANGDFQMPDFANGEFPMPNFGDGDFQMPDFANGEFPMPDFGDGENPFGEGGFPFAMGGDSDSPTPYLIKFDEYVAGQRYQGYAKLALRTAGVFLNEANLQEPVSNYAFNAAGVPIAETAYISLKIGDDEPLFYSIAEELDQVYIDRILPQSNGVLFKVQQGGNSFSYLGEDPTLYMDIYSQETAINQADMAPLIDLLRFLNESSDAEFASDLSQHFDVDDFAEYLAVNNLLVNFDSLAGMGNNYYLYYDYDEQRFTILAWDTNEGLGEMSMGGGPDFDLYWESSGGMFGGMFDKQNAPGSTDATQAPTPQTPTDAPPGRENPGRDGPAMPGGQGRPGGPGGPMGGGNNLLLTRFLATPKFKALYEEKLQLFYEQIFVADMLTPKIEEYAALMHNYNQTHALVDLSAYDAAVQDVLDFVAERYAYLKTTELLGSH